jgi:HSP20 family protein
MSSIVRWDPFAEFAGLSRAMDRMLGDLGSVRWRARLGPWADEPGYLTFPVDIWETDDKMVVRAALPGVRPEDAGISVSEGVLTIKGEAKSERTEEKQDYYCQEIRYGAFSRSIQLPVRVDPERAEAAFENGVLTVTLPKAEELRPKTIKIRAAEPEPAR